MSDDDSLFSQAMGDVKPLKKAGRQIIKKDPDSRLARDARRQAAVAETEVEANHLSAGDVPLLDPYYALEFRRDGVQKGVFRKLKQGRYQQDGRLDLHRMTVDRARREVFDFIRESIRYNLRTVIIIHGKGSHDKLAGDASVNRNPNERVALLKSYLNHWLREMDEVQAFCSARPQHGGVGAVYVMLAKSENKKRQNRESISRGRVSSDGCDLNLM